MDSRSADRPRVLIVEDEAIVAMELQDQLESMGWEVCAVAPTGADAVFQAETHRPDLILMDITLRGPMSGVEAAERIRAGGGKSVLVFLTATMDEAVAARIRKLDPAAVFLSKPFLEGELRRETERARIQRRA